MRHIPLVRASVLAPFATFLRERGFSGKAFLARSRLPAMALEDSEALIPLRLAWEFVEDAGHATEVENLGLRIGARTHLTDMGAYGRALARLPTLYQTIETASWLGAVHSSGERMWLSWQGERVRLCHAFMVDVGSGREQAEQFTLMLLVNLLRSVGGAGWQPERVEVSSIPAAKLRAMSIFSSARVSSGHDHTAITFPRERLRAPANAGRPGRSAVSVQDYSTLTASAPALDFPGSIRQLIASYLREGYPDLGRIADIAGLSERTFQRRLMKCGTTYYELVDQARFERARRYLVDPGMKLIDVALELGFSEAASFTRAFRRWAGLSPSTFRRLQRVPGAAFDRVAPRAQDHERSKRSRRPVAAA